jgi:hypothetical protein
MPAVRNGAHAGPQSPRADVQGPQRTVDVPAFAHAAPEARTPPRTGRVPLTSQQQGSISTSMRPQGSPAAQTRPDSTVQTAPAKWIPQRRSSWKPGDLPPGADGAPVARPRYTTGSLTAAPLYNSTTGSLTAAPLYNRAPQASPTLESRALLNKTAPSQSGASNQSTASGYTTSQAESRSTANGYTTPYRASQPQRYTSYNAAGEHATGRSSLGVSGTVPAAASIQRPKSKEPRAAAGDPRSAVSRSSGGASVSTAGNYTHVLEAAYPLPDSPAFSKSVPIRPSPVRSAPTRRIFNQSQPANVNAWDPCGEVA